MGPVVHGRQLAMIGGPCCGSGRGPPSLLPPSHTWKYFFFWVRLDCCILTRVNSPHMEILHVGCSMFWRAMGCFCGSAYYSTALSRAHLDGCYHVISVLCTHSASRGRRYWPWDHSPAFLPLYTTRGLQRQRSKLQTLCGSQTFHRQTSWNVGRTPRVQVSRPQ